jgi:cytochrome c oxidase assembly protein subunit 15
MAEVANPGNLNSPEHRASVSPWLHGYMVFVAVATFFLLIAGALVTSNDAGLSVPDWPTSFGSFRMPRMVGGVLYEHGHRMFAATVGLLTVILAVWVWLKETRRWVKYLAGAAVLAVIAQGILGGITVLFYLPLFVSTGHAALGQTFFCILVTLAVTTRKDWRWDEPKLDEPAGLLSTRQFAVLMVGALFVQLILGALYRHDGTGILPHAVGAIVITILALGLGVRILSRYMIEDRMAHAAKSLIGLVAVQVFLGVVAFILRIQFHDAPQPMPPLVKVSTAHVAIGALVLAQSVVLALHVFRRISPAATVPGGAMGIEQGSKS